jgi:uncharacterized repeat protein (TIGR04042 family)
MKPIGNRDTVDLVSLIAVSQEVPVPEVFFRVRWPDGSVDHCYSPSTVVEEYFSAGAEYPVAEFVERSRLALSVASKRVRERYGFDCVQAARQLSTIERTAERFGTNGCVVVEGFQR